MTGKYYIFVICDSPNRQESHTKMLETETNIDKIKLHGLKREIGCLAQGLLEQAGETTIDEKPRFRIRWGTFKVPGTPINLLLGKKIANL